MSGNSKKLNENLLINFPLIKGELEKYISWQDGMDTGSTLIYEDVFVPYIIKQLLNNNKQELEKITNFIENMINSKDEYTFNVAYIAVLETLKSNVNGKKIKDFLKENSLKEFNEINY